jgi:hypothetical protein
VLAELRMACDLYPAQTVFRCPPRAVHVSIKVPPKDGCCGSKLEPNISESFQVNKSGTKRSVLIACAVICGLLFILLLTFVLAHNVR